MKTKIIPPLPNCNALYIYFELSFYRKLTKKEIDKVLKVLNRPGYLNGINRVVIQPTLHPESSFLIERKLHIKNHDCANQIYKEISFYEGNVEYGYTLNERYKL